MTATSPRFHSSAACLLAGLIAIGCGSSAPSEWLAESHPRRYAGQYGIRLDWVERLTQDYGGAYLPVEFSSPALDPARNRLYVGTTQGGLVAMTGAGGRLYVYNTGSSVEARAAFDATSKELYVAAEDGSLHALDSATGAVRWREDAGGPLRTEPLLASDAVYVVTETDTVSAVSRKTGELLWSYRREPPGGFSITRHAGIVLAGNHLLTAFTDGTIVALDASDGRVIWERETQLDLPATSSSTEQYLDVDTTPVVIDGLVYVASFSGGLYALSLENGTVEWKDSQLTGIVHLVPTSDYLIASSGDLGLVAIGLGDRRVRWRRRVSRGAAGPPVVYGRTIFVGESKGAFLALALDTGRELGRIESGHGFSAPAAITGGRGFVLSNGGSLFAFSAQL